MPFPLPEDFKPGAPLRDLVTTEIMKTVAGILNHLTVEVREGVDYPYIEKTARPGGQQPWVIVLPAPAAPADAGPDLADTDPLADDDPASAGTAVTASRADHAHPLNVDDETTPEKDAASGAVGTSAAYARADHAHPLNVDDETTPEAIAASGAVGVSSAYARADHIHGISLFVPELSDAYPMWEDAETGSAGTSGDASRADHQHPGAIIGMAKGEDILSVMQADGTPHYGNLDLYSREDHAHPLNAPTASGGDGGDTPSDIIPDPDEEESGAAGSSEKYARADHVHRCDGCLDTPSSPASKTNVSTGTTEPTTNNSTTWTYGGTYGLQLTLVTGLYYNHTATTPQLIARVRTFVFDVRGRLYSMTAEGSYVVDQPVKVTIATS